MLTTLRTIPSALAFLSLMITAIASAGAPSTSSQLHLTAEEATADVRGLADLLESTHPDPYLRGGGKLAFARRLHDTLALIPKEGLSSSELLGLLRPFTAALHDGHTRIHSAFEPSEQKSAPFPARPWVDFAAVEGRLYVARVYRPDDRKWLGAILTQIEGVSAADLIDRVNALDGCDNLYQSLEQLANRLSVPDDLAVLLRCSPKELPRPELKMGLQMADGSLITASVPYASRASVFPVQPPTVLNDRLPKLNAADLGASFLAEDGSVACLRLSSMMRYREAFEEWRATGFVANLGDHLTQTAAAASGVDPATLQTENVDLRIARVPSASEEFTKLCAEMNRRSTRTLIVDLRGNEGGNSTVASIFVACLYGTKAAERAETGYQIARFSALYFSTHRSDSLVEVRTRTGNPRLELGDCDFFEEERWKRRQKNGWTTEEIENARAEMATQSAHCPTFGQLLKGPLATGNPLWHGRVLVITDANTYSAGFDLAVALLRQGATMVGVPPAQAGNCFIDICPAKLTYSHLELSISYKASFLFPDDPQKGQVLHPGRELTYDQLRRWNFDPEASLRLALEEAASPQTTSALAP